MKEPEISVINGRTKIVKARSGCIAERHAIVLGTRGPVQRQECSCRMVWALNSSFVFAHYTCDTTPNTVCEKASWTPGSSEESVRGFSLFFYQ